MKCKHCGKLKNKHIKGTIRKNREYIEVLYCYSIKELKEKRIDWDNFVKKKWKELKKGKEDES